MKDLTQNKIVSLITDLNAFADRAENLISSTQVEYEKNKKLLIKRHDSILLDLDNTYKKNCDLIKEKSKYTIDEAKNVLLEIDKLDDKLSKADKYYVKTKIKKESLLIDSTSDKYDKTTDYFRTLNDIKSCFNTISKKYSEDILPGLINGLSYLFSNQRKKDYEELIILRNTVVAFVKEIEELLPQVAEENLTEIKDEYYTQRGNVVEKHKNEINVFENNHYATLDNRPVRKLNVGDYKYHKSKIVAKQSGNACSCILTIKYENA